MESNAQYIEQELYQRIATGDEKAFVEVHALYKAKLFYFTRRLLADWQEVEEVVSDSFIALWTSRTQLRSDAHLRNFLFLTARNKAIDLKKAKTRLDKNKEGLQIAEATYDNALEIEMARVELLHQLREAVAQLPAEYRKIFDLCYDEQKSPSEIAAILNANPATIRSQKRRAFEMIRKSIKDKTILLLILISFSPRELPF